MRSTVQPPSPPGRPSPGRTCRLCGAGARPPPPPPCRIGPPPGPNRDRSPHRRSPRAIRRSRMKVESLGAPPPALSETSASTTGPPSIASARSMASSIPTAVGRVSSRIAQSRAPRSAASAAALPSSPSATTRVLAPTSATSPQGKPCPNETARIPSLPSRTFMRSTKVRIGSSVVRHMLIMRQSWAAIAGFGFAPPQRPGRAGTGLLARSPMSMWGYSL